MQKQHAISDWLFQINDRFNVTQIYYQCNAKEKR